MDYLELQKLRAWMPLPCMHRGMSAISLQHLWIFVQDLIILSWARAPVVGYEACGHHLVPRHLPLSLAPGRDMLPCVSPGPQGSPTSSLEAPEASLACWHTCRGLGLAMIIILYSSLLSKEFLSQGIF